MGWHHHHDHSHTRGDQSGPALKGAFLITSTFMVVEFIGGWLTNSLALMSDAAHMLTDSGALLMSMAAFWIARRPTNPKMSYGYARAEILGALLSGLFIWALGGVLIYEAIGRFQNPPRVDGFWMLPIAGFGLIVNLISLKFLTPAKDENINVRAAYLHVVADSLGSVGALIAGVIIWQTGWTLADPIMTCLIAVLVLYSAWNLVRESVGILMESTPRGIDLLEVQNRLRALEKVSEVHDLHVWTVTSGKLSASVHLVSEGDTQTVLNSAKRVLHDDYGIAHTTIQIEHPDQFDSAHCYDCAN